MNTSKIAAGLNILPEEILLITVYFFKIKLSGYLAIKKVKLVQRVHNCTEIPEQNMMGPE